MLRIFEDRVAEFRLSRWFKRTLKDWLALQASQVLLPLQDGAPRRFVLVPCDPWTFVGSKGDEAMIRAVLGQLSKVSPGLRLLTFTATDAATSAAQSLGFEVQQIWDSGPSEMAKAVRSFEADSLAVLGADCMDGHYSPITTLNMLAVADLASRMGVRTSILGFSFNAHPFLGLKLAFEALHDRVHIHIRDEVSFERFKSFCNAKAKLVADAAFQLIPDAQAQVVQELADWTRLQKEAGRRVVGFNIHPMLLHDPSPSQLDQLIEQVASALDAYLNRAPVALVLISHDYRTTVGDDVCLQPLWKRLSVRFGDRIHYDRSICSAAELKAKAGLMDGVVTGRMHFAIACLGMAVPVAALTYQDKFQGLMKHVDLPQDLLLQPSDLADPDKLVSLMLRFHDDMATLRARVEARVPAVMAASALNVAPLIGV